jgi:hypothetical protein
MSKDIGFVLLKLLNNSIYDHILQCLKSISIDRPYDQAVIFNSYSEKAETFNLPILHLTQCKFFTGTLFLFDLPSVILTSTFPNITKRILYIGDIPWLNNPATRHKEWSSLYNQTNLDFIVQTQELYDIYNMCWKKPLTISENFNYEQIKSFI